MLVIAALEIEDRLVFLSQTAERHLTTSLQREQSNAAVDALHLHQCQAGIEPFKIDVILRRAAYCVSSATIVRPVPVVRSVFIASSGTISHPYHDKSPQSCCAFSLLHLLPLLSQARR